MEWPIRRKLFLVIDSDSRGPAHDVRESLKAMLERAMVASQATGGAIALGAGREMVCLGIAGKCS